MVDACGGGDASTRVGGSQDVVTIDTEGGSGEREMKRGREKQREILCLYTTTNSVTRD